MHEYPLDHPLQRIALAYFENYEDEVGVRYALDALNIELKQYDFDAEEFADCLDFIVNELLYNEEESLIAVGLQTLCSLILKSAFPASYHTLTMERLVMIEAMFRKEGVVLGGLVECLLGIWIYWDEAPDLQDQAKKLLDLLGEDAQNVSRLKALARGLGASMLMPEISSDQAAECLRLLQDLLKRNDDWRVRVYVAQSLSLVLQEGFVGSQETILPLMALVEGFLSEPYPQSLYRPVAEFFSKVLTLGALNEVQVNHCWCILFKLPGLVGEGATQRATLQQLGMAMHWKAMTLEQEQHCYNVFRNALDAAEEERTLHDMMIVVAQAIAGMYSWGRTEWLKRWGGLFSELLLEVDPQAAYGCLNAFLRGPMAKVCFTQEHLDQLTDDVLRYAESDEKGAFICVQVLDGMVASSLLSEKYFERFWALLLQLWGQEQRATRGLFLEFLSRSASGLVTDLKASEAVRRQIFKEMLRLFERAYGDERKMLALAQVFPVFIGLSERLPSDAFSQLVGVLLSLLMHPCVAIRIIAFDGLDRALHSSALTAESFALIGAALLEVDIARVNKEALAAYVKSCQALEAHALASEAVRHAASQRIFLLMGLEA